MKAKIYLDFNSTHPPNEAALKLARDFYFTHFANSSGLSLESQAVNKRIEEAREDIACLFSVEPRQIVFTSCATESNNLLIREFHAKRRNKNFRVLSSPFEHPSVAECLKQLPDTEIVYLSSDKTGKTEVPDITETSEGDFDLITMMAVQNESGVVLPLSELIASLPENHPPVLADFSQALPKLAADAPEALRPEFIAALARRNIFLTATGHKVGAGFGAGLIVTPPGGGVLRETALLAGGNQEFGLRAGSHNIEAIIAFAEALKHKLGANRYGKWQEVTARFENLLMTAIRPLLPLSVIGDAPAGRAPGTTLLLLPGIPIDFLIMALDKEGITVSTGTSCKSRSRSPSAALLAMGYGEADALSVVRFSYDQNLSGAEMESVAQALASAIQKLA